MFDSTAHSSSTIEWKTLHRDEASDLIQRLTAGADADMFPNASCGMQMAQLPFYKHFVLYRVINYNTMPVFSIEFLGDGDTFYRLDGSPDPILLVNSRGDLNLTLDTALDYIRFFFDYVSTDEGEMTLVDDPDDLPFIDSLDMQQQILLKQRHEKPSVVYDEDKDVYTLSCDVFYTGSLLQVDIDVDQEGHIHIRERGLLMHDTLSTPYAQGGYLP